MKGIHLLPISWCCPVIYSHIHVNCFWLGIYMWPAHHKIKLCLSLTSCARDSNLLVVTVTKGYAQCVSCFSKSSFATQYYHSGCKNAGWNCSLLVYIECHEKKQICIEVGKLQHTIKLFFHQQSYLVVNVFSSLFLIWLHVEQFEKEKNKKT